MIGPNRTSIPCLVSLAAACLIPLTAGAQTTSAAAPPGAAESHMREGFWVLNLARSKELTPGSQTLWVVKDNGKVLIWVSISKDPAGMVKVISFDGRYNGDAVPVVGTSMVSRVASNAPNKIQNSGQIVGTGPYKEDCTVFPDGKRFTCDGEVEAKDGVHRWHDDFDWVGPSPQ